VAEKFVKQDGSVKPGLEAFLKKNKKMMDRFPDLKAVLGNAQDRTAILQRATRQAKVRKDLLAKSAISDIVKDENPADVIGRVFAGKQPQKDYRVIASTAKKSGPEAVEGLKTATLENLSARSHGFEHLLENSEGSLKIMVKNGVMKPEEATKLSNVLKRAATLEANAARTAGRAGDIGDSPVTSEWLDTMIRIVGAKAGAGVAGKTSGAQLVAAGQGSKFLRKLLENSPFDKTVKILQAASQNPKLMAELLKKHRTPKLKEESFTRIRAALVAAGIAPNEEQPAQP
jgi:hypothetical protein